MPASKVTCHATAKGSLSASNSTMYPNTSFSFRLATYDLAELQMEGDGNCQVVVYNNLLSM